VEEPVIAPLVALALAAGAPVPARVSPVPDAALVDQDGREVRVVTELLAGRTVLVNFVFTRCTTICPPMTAVFGRLQDELGAHYGRDVRLITISLDPETDTPERMAKFLKPFKPRAGWSFLSGDRERVRAVAKALGGWEDEKMSHAPVALVGNLDAGVWYRVDNFAKPKTLAAEALRVHREAAEKLARR
jgi:protein SCO1/2